MTEAEGTASAQGQAGPEGEMEVGAEVGATAPHSTAAELEGEEDKERGQQDQEVAMEDVGAEAQPGPDFRAVSVPQEILSRRLHIPVNMGGDEVALLPPYSLLHLSLLQSLCIARTLVAHICLSFNAHPYGK